MRQDFLKGTSEQTSSAEKEIEKALRPLSFEDFAGQDKIVENLRVFVQAATKRGEALDMDLLGWEKLHFPTLLPMN
jgi:holliday junction DNA helicase RuvB